MSEKKKSDLTLKILAGGLVAAVGVQSYFMYKLFSRTEDKVISQTPETAAVQVQQIPTMRAQTTNPSQPAMRSIALNNSPAVNNQPGRLPQISGFGNMAPWQGMMMNQDPFEELEKMQEMMEQMLRGSGMTPPSSMSSFAPGHGFGGGFGMSQSLSPKISNHNNNYVVTLNIPGLDKSNIQTRVNGNMLTIAGTQKEEVKNTQGQSFSSSTSYKQFQSSFNLPGRVKSEGMKVDYDKDVLTITIPRA